MENVKYRYGHWVIRHRWWIIIATIFLVGVSASGVKHLKINQNSRIFFSEENPQLQAMDALDNTYSKNENVFIAIAPKSGNVFTKETLSVVRELTELCWEIPYSSRVDSITNFQHTYAHGDELVVEDLVDHPDRLTQQAMERVKQIALSEPLLINRLISPSAHVTGININIIKPGKSIQEVPDITKYTRQLIADCLKKNSDIDIYLTGAILVDATFGEAGEKDIKTLIPIMFLVLIVIMGITLRSVSGTVATFIVLIVSVLTGMGLAGWFKIDLNPSSANAPIIILTLAIADSIHILSTMLQQMRQGTAKKRAIAESLRVNMQPVFLTSLTTAIGFLALNFSDSPPFRDLGNIVTIGIIAAFIYSMTFLPSIMAVIPVRVTWKKEVESNTIFDKLSCFVINRQKSILCSMLLFVLITSLGISRIELNDDFHKYFDQSFDFRRASDFVRGNLTGINTIKYSLSSGKDYGISDYEYLKTVEAFAIWYQTQPYVVHVNVLTDTIKRLNKNMHGDNPEYYRIPKNPDLVAQYLLLYEMSLPFGLDLNNEINVNKSSIRMVVTLSDIASKEIRETDLRAQAWLKANASASMLTCGSSMSVTWAHISKRTIKSMLSASFGALVLISIILIIALRSIKFGLLSLIPNLTPAFMAFGLWGIINSNVGLAISVLVAATLGIVVDDTIHVMSKYLRVRKEQGLSPSEAIQYTFHNVGNALWVTTVTLVAGFLTFSLSGFKINHELGLMSAITIFFAFILDLFLLPILLLKIDEKVEVNQKKRSAPVSIGGRFRTLATKNNYRNS